MPVRSLNSAVLRWPSRDEVLPPARRWAASLRRSDPTVEAVLCVGSYARGDWGVGSDLDIIIVTSDIALSCAERRARYEPEGIPVPADLWVYTRSEWNALPTYAPHLWQRLQREKVDLATDGPA